MLIKTDALPHEALIILAKSPSFFYTKIKYLKNNTHEKNIQF